MAEPKLVWADELRKAMETPIDITKRADSISIVAVDNSTSEQFDASTLLTFLDEFSMGSLYPVHPDTKGVTVVFTDK